MDIKDQKAISLATIDKSIESIEQNAATLRAAIESVMSSGHGAKAQAELLAAMLHVIDTLKVLRAEFNIN